MICPLLAIGALSSDAMASVPDLRRRASCLGPECALYNTGARACQLKVMP